MTPAGSGISKVSSLGAKRLDAGIPDDCKLLVRPQHHVVGPGIGGLNHVESGSTKEFLAFGVTSGHFQDHFGFARSAIRDAVAGLVGNLGFDHGQGPDIILFRLEGIGQRVNLHRQ